jgi:hypothetical protein
VVLFFCLSFDETADSCEFRAAIRAGGFELNEVCGNGALSV